jgi:hypothetical protein
MLQRIVKEPVVTALVTRMLAAAAARYGLELTVEQVLGLVVVMDAVLAWIVRSKVTPTAKPTTA